MAKRPFWMHQGVEYLLGVMLIITGLQSPTPAVPAVVGGIVILNAAITRGPLSAFRLIGRRTHRVLDVGIIALEVVAVVQPWVTVESSTRLVMALIPVVHTFVWWQSNYAEKPKKAVATPPAGTDAPTDDDRATTMGRTAGRAVGQGVNAVKRMTAKRADD